MHPSFVVFGSFIISGFCFYAHKDIQGLSFIVIGCTAFLAEVIMRSRD